MLAGTATAAGMTTTALSVPVLMVINGFGVKQAVPMMQLIAVVSGLAGVVGLQWRAGKGGLQRSVPVLLGNYYGVWLARALPDAVLLGVLTLGMGLGGYELGERAKSAGGDSTNLTISLTKVKKSGSKENPRIFFFSPQRLFIPFGMYAATLLTICLLGGPAMPSLISVSPCSVLFWVITGLYGVLGVVLAFFWPYLERRPKQAMLIPQSERLLSVIAGFCSGIAGLTSEIYLPALSPVSAQHRQLPTPLSLLLCASAAFLHYAVLNSVSYPYAIWHAVWAGIGAVTGTALREKLKYSACVRLLALLHALATALMPIYTVLLILQVLRAGQSPISILPLC